MLRSAGAVLCGHHLKVFWAYIVGACGARPASDGARLDATDVRCRNRNHVADHKVVAGDSGRALHVPTSHPIIVAFMLSVTLAPTPSLALAAGTVIQGQVVNLSRQHPVASQQVFAQFIRHGRLLSTQRIVTNKVGGFRLLTARGDSILLVTDFHGVRYVEPASAGAPIPFPVFDTRTSDRGLVVPEAQVALRREGSAYLLVEEWRFANAGMPLMTDIGNGLPIAHASATFPLPPTAYKVAIRHQADLLAARAEVDHAAIVVNGVIRPAVQLDPRVVPFVTFRFNMPRQVHGSLLSIRLPYPTQRIDIVSFGVPISAPGLHETRVKILGESATRWTASNVSANSTINLGLDVRPIVQSALASPSLPPVAIVIVLLLFVCLLAIGLKRTAPVGAIS